MEIRICKNSEELGKSAAKQVAQILKDCIAEKGSARIVLSTGASQFDTIKALVEEKDIKWECVEMFHLDEYVDLPVTHVASFRKYLQERFVDKVGTLKAVHFVDGTKECIAKLTEEIRKSPIDVGLIGIGENGHIAFNDPGVADFNDEAVVKVVELDQMCRQQQVNDGCFKQLDDVPKYALTLTIPTLVAAESVFCIVPAKTKANAVNRTVNGETVEFARYERIYYTKNDIYAYSVFRFDKNRGVMYRFSEDQWMSEAEAKVFDLKSAMEKDMEAHRSEYLPASAPTSEETGADGSNSELS